MAMSKLVIIAVLLSVALGQCADQCGTCKQENNPYSCLRCLPNDDNIYLFSCPVPAEPLLPYYALAAIVTGLQLFMLCVGLGVYKDLFQNIQLVTLLNWRYGFGGGLVVLEYTNLGAVSSNNFPASFGSQFIIVMCLIGFYWLLQIFVDYLPASLADLIKRKRITFPTRIVTLVFNMLLFSSLMQVTTVQTEPDFKAFAFVLASLALFKIVFVLVGLAVYSNWQHFSL